MHNLCPKCQIAKIHNLPFKASNFVSSKRLDLIYIDVWGPTSMVSTTDAKYYVGFFDDYSKFL